LTDIVHSSEHAVIMPTAAVSGTGVASSVAGASVSGPVPLLSAADRDHPRMSHVFASAQPAAS